MPGGGGREQAHALDLLEQRGAPDVVDREAREALVVRDRERVIEALEPTSRARRGELRGVDLVGASEVAAAPARRAGCLAQHRGRGHELHQRRRRVGARGREGLRIGRDVREDLAGRRIHRDHLGQVQAAARQDLADLGLERRVDRVLDRERRRCLGRRGADAGRELAKRELEVGRGLDPRRRRLALLDPGVQRPGGQQGGEKAQRREDVARQDDPQTCERSEPTTPRKPSQPSPRFH